MKHKIANKLTIPLTENDQDVMKFKGKINCQGPNEYLYKFEGNMAFQSENKELVEDEVANKYNEVEIPIDANQMLLRGSSLRNTEYVYGIVVYTGHESKIMKNSPSARNKSSKIERKTNKLIIFTFLFQVCACLFASIYCNIWNNVNEEETDQYLGWSVSTSVLSTNKFVAFFVSLGTWLLIF